MFVEQWQLKLKLLEKLVRKSLLPKVNRKHRGMFNTNRSYSIEIFSSSSATRALKDAADVIMQSPTALQLRYLQTLTTIASEKNSTIVFPIPVMEMMTGFNLMSYLETSL